MINKIVNPIKEYFFFVLIVFLFIFGVPTSIGSITPLLSVCIILYCCLKYSLHYIEVPKFIFCLFVFLLFDLLLCLLIPVIYQTYDFSIIKTKINFIFSILATYGLSLLLIKKFNEEKFIKTLLFVFMLQVLIIFSMLLNSNISEFITSITRQGESTKIIENYGGARGLGYADSGAFGLAIVMGSFLLLVFFAYIKKYINLLVFMILISLGAIASVSAGRVSLLGILLGIVIILLSINKKRSIIILISIFTLSICGILLLINIDPYKIENDALRYFYFYSMEPILNFQYSGKLSASSTDRLQEMYFPLTERQFLFGDGMYTDESGYYLKTDAGYMRSILFYGVFISTLVYLSFLMFSAKMLNYVNSFNKNLILILIILSFLFHYKGEVILYAISFNKFIFLIYFYYYFNFRLKND